MYTAFVIDEDVRMDLGFIFVPQYDNFIGHHVTEQFGLSKDQFEARTGLVRVIGYIDSTDGLEALVCSVDGNIRRPDGKIYHITWSLNPSTYKPVQSNDLLSSGKQWTIVRPFTVGEVDLSFLTA